MLATATLARNYLLLAPLRAACNCVPRFPITFSGSHINIHLTGAGRNCRSGLQCEVLPPASNRHKTNMGVGARSPAGLAARVRILALEADQRKIVIARASNLSAAPFSLWGSGYTEGMLFPRVLGTRKTHGQDGAPRRPTVAAQLSTD